MDRNFWRADLEASTLRKVIEGFAVSIRFELSKLPLELVNVLIKYLQITSNILSNEDLNIVENWIIDTFQQIPYNDGSKDDAKIKITNKKKQLSMKNNYEIKFKPLYYDIDNFYQKKFHKFCDFQGPTLVMCVCLAPRFFALFFFQNKSLAFSFCFVFVCFF